MNSGNEVQKLPGREDYTFNHNGNGQVKRKREASHSFLPPIIPQVQTKYQVHPFPLPPISGLHITTSIAPQRTAPSPDNRHSPYGQASSRKTSPTQHPKLPKRSSDQSPEGSVPNRMRMRQEAFPPPLYEPPLNIHQFPQAQLPPPASPGGYEPRSTSAIPAMMISSLIHAVPIMPVTELYSIRVRQQPVDARMCGNGLQDRRHIDPPPVVQLFLNDPSMNLKDIDRKLVVLHCFLYNADSDKEERLTETGHKRLEGNTSASPTVGVDDHNTMGAFFIFPDLSCRTAGHYRLQFRLSVTNLEPSAQGEVVPFLATTLSEVFHVSLPTGPGKFPGMSESTALTKAMKAAGASVKLRRGTSAAARNGGKGFSPGESEEGESNGRGKENQARGKGRQRVKIERE